MRLFRVYCEMLFTTDAEFAEGFFKMISSFDFLRVLSLPAPWQAGASAVSHTEA